MLTIPIHFKSFRGLLQPYTIAEPVVSYQVMGDDGYLQGHFNLMSDGWSYFPNGRGFDVPGFEEFLKGLVTEKTS